MKFSDQLKQYRNENGLTQVKLASLLGLSARAYAQYEGGEFDNNPKKVHQYTARLHEINLNNLDSKPTREQGLAYTALNVIPTILHVPVEAEAGFIGGDTDPVMNEDLQVWNMPGFDEPGYSFRVRGDSMYPTFKEGEIVITSRKQEPFDLIRKQFIYVVVTKDNILIKRVEQDKKKEGLLRLISDNPAYEPIEVKYDDVKIYKARRNFTWDLSKKYSE